MSDCIHIEVCGTCDVEPEECGYYEPQRGKCRIVSEIVNNYGYAPQPTDYTWELSCGHRVTWNDLPDYCPWCGAEVEQ